MFIIKKYIINFWLWWYRIEVKEFGRNMLRLWMYMLGRFNVVPMATNLFTPLYQDYSAVGRMISLIIRSVWVVVGGSLQLIVTIPIVIIFVILVFLPLIPIYMIISFLV
jgi:hypothetical protein